MKKNKFTNKLLENFISNTGLSSEQANKPPVSRSALIIFDSQFTSNGINFFFWLTFAITESASSK